MDPISRKARVTQIPPLAIDVGLTVAYGVAIAIAIGTGHERGAQSPDVLAYALGVAVAAPLLLRRRWPLQALLLASTALMIYHATNYPATGLALPLSGALYAAAAAGHLKWSLVVVATLIVGGAVGRALLDVSRESVLLQLQTGALLDAALMVAVVLLGDAVYSRRAWMSEVQERLRQAQAERDREAQRRVGEERLRIARELHDVVAHTVAVVSVQAGVAADVLDESPAEAKAALDTIRAASRNALAELRTTVEVLRGDGDEDAPRSPAPGLSQVESLIGMARDSGVQVELSVTGNRRLLPPTVDLTAYRIVQESLTNVVRHSGAKSATVTLTYDESELAVEVTDDGCGPHDHALARPGHGLTGMIERAKAVGGWLETGTASSGGFRLAAHLPTRGSFA